MTCSCSTRAYFTSCHPWPVTGSSCTHTLDCFLVSQLCSVCELPHSHIIALLHFSLDWFHLSYYWLSVRDLFDSFYIRNGTIMTVANDFLSTSPADQSRGRDLLGNPFLRASVVRCLSMQSNLILLTVGWSGSRPTCLSSLSLCSLLRAQPQRVCCVEISFHLIVMPIFGITVLLIALRIVCLLDSCSVCLFTLLAIASHTNPNLRVEQETLAPKFDLRASRKLALACDDFIINCARLDLRLRFQSPLFNAIYWLNL